MPKHNPSYFNLQCRYSRTAIPFASNNKQHQGHVVGSRCGASRKLVEQVVRSTQASPGRCFWRSTLREHDHKELPTRTAMSRNQCSLQRKQETRLAKASAVNVISRKNIRLDRAHMFSNIVLCECLGGVHLRYSRPHCSSTKYTHFNHLILL